MPAVVALVLFKVIVVSIGEQAVSVVVVAPVVVPPTLYPVEHVRANAEFPSVVEEFSGHATQELPTPVPFRKYPALQDVYILISLHVYPAANEFVAKTTPINNTKNLRKQRIFPISSSLLSFMVVKMRHIAQGEILKINQKNMFDTFLGLDFL